MYSNYSEINIADSYIWFDIIKKPFNIDQASLWLMPCGWMERQYNGKIADETSKIFQEKSNKTLMKDIKTRTTAILNSSWMIPNSTITSQIHFLSTSSKKEHFQKQHFKKLQIKQQLYKKTTCSPSSTLPLVGESLCESTYRWRVQQPTEDCS